jgi:hypothetical protein
MSRSIFDEAIADPAERWRPYWYPETHPPLNWLHLEIWRREWPGSRFVTQAEMDSVMNVFGLFWREP